MNIRIYAAGLLVPVIGLVVGLIAKAKPAKNINSTIGYRSKKSKSSQEMWDKAQVLMAKYFIMISAVLLVVSLIAGYFIASMSDWNSMIIGICILSIVQVLGICAVIPLVESKLN